MSLHQYRLLHRLPLSELGMRCNTRVWYWFHTQIRQTAPIAPSKFCSVVDSAEAAEGFCAAQAWWCVASTVAEITKHIVYWACRWISGERAIELGASVSHSWRQRCSVFYNIPRVDAIDWLLTFLACIALCIFHLRPCMYVFMCLFIDLFHTIFTRRYDRRPQSLPPATPSRSLTQPRQQKADGQLGAHRKPPSLPSKPLWIAWWDIVHS